MLAWTETRRTPRQPGSFRFQAEVRKVSNSPCVFGKPMTVQQNDIFRLFQGFIILETGRKSRPDSALGDEFKVI